MSIYHHLQLHLLSSRQGEWNLIVAMTWTFIYSVVPGFRLQLWLGVLLVELLLLQLSPVHSCISVKRSRRQRRRNQHWTQAMWDRDQTCCMFPPIWLLTTAQDGLWWTGYYRRERQLARAPVVASISAEEIHLRPCLQAIPFRSIVMMKDSCERDMLLVNNVR